MSKESGPHGLWRIGLHEAASNLSRTTRPGGQGGCMNELGILSLDPHNWLAGPSLLMNTASTAASHTANAAAGAAPSAVIFTAYLQRIAGTDDELHRWVWSAAI